MNLLREPLVHFLLIGAALFAIFSFAGRWTSDAENHIEISSAQIKQLIEGFRIDYKREPTADDVQKLIADYVREEVLCREAWKRGLDRNDTVIRQRLRRIFPCRESALSRGSVNHSLNLTAYEFPMRSRYRAGFSH